MRQVFDHLFYQIADYVCEPPEFSPLAYETAKDCLLDALGCAFLALSFKAATKLIGPWVPGQTCEPGARVLGTAFTVDPMKAAFDNGLLIRWLDYNDTWLAREWGHPSDNLGAILAVIDYRQRVDGIEFCIKDMLDAMIMAYEIQGMLAEDNGFNQVGLDHVILVKLASAAVCMKLFGGNRDQILDVISQVFVDGQSLRTYRHAPNTGSRKSWAAGEACSRALFLCLMTLKGEAGYPTSLTARVWGFQDALNKGNPVILSNELGCYVMENILFKVSFPAEFHAQTAVEAAIRLHPLVKKRLNEITRIDIATQAAAVRIIDKTGHLNNPADRDHCLQYMTAVGLVFGELTAESYEDTFACDSRIDQLRNLMHVYENPQFTTEYFDPQKRAIPNAITIHFKDGSSLSPVQVDYPLGHRSRRAEAKSALFSKATSNLSGQLTASQIQKLIDLFNQPRFSTVSTHKLFELIYS